MNALQADYPNVKFVYMTGHLTGTGSSGNVAIRNKQIRTYCRTNKKTLLDFSDIESFDPAGTTNYTQLLLVVRLSECGHWIIGRWWRIPGGPPYRRPHYAHVFTTVFAARWMQVAFPRLTAPKVELSPSIAIPQLSARGS